MNRRNIRSKIQRIRNGGAPRVLDLFAGCGGLSLGFHAAGYEISAALEMDPDAASSHGANFHPGSKVHSLAHDITQTSPSELALQLGLGATGNSIDVIVGGPPCQAFARVGRSKLRAIEEHPEAFIHDPRAKLYIHYLRYVESFQPVAVLMENVPDILNHGGLNIAEEICEALRKRGYICAYTLLNAAYYGVPQTRERMFLIALREEVAAHITFPAPTHWIELPPGYEGSRAVALKLLGKGELYSEAHSYVEPPEALPDLPPAVTAIEALGDLPPIMARDLVRSGELKRGARRFTKLTHYDQTRPISAYAEALKDWTGFEAGDGVYDHVTRYLTRDYDLFARMNHGDQYPEAYQHALRMLDEKIADLAYKGTTIRQGTKQYEELKKSIVPPYDPGKFPNKWRKMWPDQPARTLMAHLGKDGYSHIHYDNVQARTISVREAARLQSFPDGFQFKGTMNPAFKQIGNSVPPLMSKALADHILITLTAIQEGEQNVAQRQAAAI